MSIDRNELRRILRQQEKGTLSRRSLNVHALRANRRVVQASSIIPKEHSKVWLQTRPADWPAGTLVRLWLLVSEDGVEWTRKFHADWDTSVSPPGPDDLLSLNISVLNLEKNLHVQSEVELLRGSNADVAVEILSA